VTVTAPAEPTQASAHSSFPQIADYAFLSDCATTALVAPNGSVEWMCLPRADSPSVFAALLDRSAGFFRFGPVHMRVPASRRYLPGSMALETTWATPTGWLVVTDALVMAKWAGTKRVEGQRRPPGDFSACGMLVRTATCISGQVDLMLDCMPLFDYGRAPGAWEAFGYFAFLMDAWSAGTLQIMYGIDGERELDEQVLDNLRGYNGARPVRIGNGAYNQHQHDVWGMAMEAAALYFENAATEIGPLAWEGLRSLVEKAIEVWRQPDRGIWEVRGEPRHFTASKVMCWVAADRGARLARARDDTVFAERWQQAAGEMKADICAHGLDDRGVFVQVYGGSGLDASALLIPLMGFLPPDDERVRATVLAIADELTSDGLVLRYRPDETDDGLSGAEGTFTICSFWLVSALALIGETGRARALCAKLLSLASPLHLYAEEIDAASGMHLGNFPQAFTHLALIDAVLRVIAADEAGAAVPS